MNLRSKIKSLLNQALEENPSLFLIDLKISLENNIKVVLDGDDEVSLSDCIKISRVIEHNLDREVEGFSLEVTSAGVGEPLFNRRQYLKNIGRKLKVEIPTGNSFQGTLVESRDKDFTIKWKQRELKPVGKGKITVEKIKTFSYKEITKAKVVV